MSSICETYINNTKSVIKLLRNCRGEVREIKLQNTFLFFLMKSRTRGHL